MLRAFFCHNYAEHEPPQSQRERQTWSGPLHLDEPRDQRGGRPTRGAAQSTINPALLFFVDAERCLFYVLMFLLFVSSESL